MRTMPAEVTPAPRRKAQQTDSGTDWLELPTDLPYIRLPEFPIITQFT